jgi:hypothetical protein
MRGGLVLAEILHYPPALGREEPGRFVVLAVLQDGLVAPVHRLVTEEALTVVPIAVGSDRTVLVPPICVIAREEQDCRRSSGC